MFNRRKVKKENKNFREAILKSLNHKSNANNRTSFTDGH